MLLSETPHDNSIPSRIKINIERQCAQSHNDADVCHRSIVFFIMASQGTTDNIGDDAGEMGDDLAVVDLGDLSATSIAAGCDFTCAIVDDGSVMCW